MDPKDRPMASFGLTLSKQYGAWSILFACYFAGALVGGGRDAAILILFPLVVLGFMARHGAGVYFRSRDEVRRTRLLGWVGVYSLLILLLGAVLVLVYEMWTLVPFGIIALAFGAVTIALAQLKKETTVSGELVGILGLTLVAPITGYVSAGSLSSSTVAVWILCASFFCGSVFHVRYLVRRRADTLGPLATRLRSGYDSLAYHSVVLVTAIALSLAGILPPLSPLALVPGSVRAWAGVGRRLRKPLPVRTIGVAEIINTVFFVVLLVLTFRLL